MNVRKAQKNRQFRICGWEAVWCCFLRRHYPDQVDGSAAMTISSLPPSQPELPELPTNM